MVERKRIKVTILSLDDAMASSVIGPADIFGQVGVAWNDIIGTQAEPRFDVEIVTRDGAPSRLSSNVQIKPHGAMQKVEATDIILISSGITEELDEFEQDVLPWLHYHHRQGTTLAALCTGSFLLAETGLLNGREATTHWGYAEHFRRRYPKVILKAECMVTDEDNLLCSGGANAYTDLCVYLVQKHCGHELTTQLTRSMALDFNRGSQTRFALFAFQKGHGDASILLAQKHIEEHYHKAIRIEELSQIARVSERTFKRRFKKATGDTPLVYLHRARMEAAKQGLENSYLNIDEIAHAVGFSDTGRFRAVFKYYIGMTPKEYRQKLL